MTKGRWAGTAAVIALLALLAFSGSASAQSTDCVLGYSTDVCPDEVTDPGDPSDPGDPASELARTGSNNAPLARAAFVLIAVGGALTIAARRKRVEQHSG